MRLPLRVDPLEVHVLQKPPVPSMILGRAGEGLFSVWVYGCTRVNECSMASPT